MCGRDVVRVRSFVHAYRTARGPLDGLETNAVVDSIVGLFPDVDHSKGWPRLLRDLTGW